MPIYLFRGQSCGAEEEHLQRMTDKPLSICSACKKPQLRKIVAPSSFSLKGDGWYKDHYGLKPPASSE